MSLAGTPVDLLRLQAERYRGKVALSFSRNGDGGAHSQLSRDGVGETWITGLSVGHGSMGKRDESARTFWAFPSDSAEERYLRTGDRGFVRRRFDGGSHL